MKRILVAVVLIIAVPSLVRSQAEDKVSEKAGRESQARQASKAEEEVMRLESEYLDARVKNDQATLDRILADDYVAVASSGNVSTDKRASLARANTTPGGQKFVSLSFDDARVRVYDNTAVLTGRRLIKAEGGEGQLRFMHVFVRRQGRWQMVASQVTSISQQ